MNGDAMDWIERLGGWGVVLLVVRWMMSRMDRMIDNLQSTASAFVEFRQEFHQYRQDDERVHGQIVQELQGLREDQNVKTAGR